MMNERIRELDAQSLVKSEGQWVFSKEKFAELIVGECSRIADDWVNNEDNGKNYPSDKIKEHFGVGE